MLCLGVVSTNLFRLFYAGEIQNLNCRRLEMATYSGVLFFYTWVRFAREGKAVALQYHEQGSTDTNVCGGFAVVRSLSVDEHKHNPARIRARQEYATLIKFCTLRSELHTGSALMFFMFVGCQTSTNFKLASLGMRGAQERALLVPDDNIGTYGSCTII